MTNNITGEQLSPLVGDTVDGVSVERVFSTGKIELADGRSLHIRQLDFIAGSNSGAEFTRARDFQPHIR